MTKSDEGAAIRLAGLRAEEGDLAYFFDAARAAPIEPPPALLRAILADAAAVAGAPAPRARRIPLAERLDALLRPLGGWAGASALAGCLALGLWAGALGTGADMLGGALWADVVTLDNAVDGVDGFFDLAMTEG